MNLHLPPAPDLDAEVDLRGLDLAARARALRDALDAHGVATGNVMLLDTDLLRRDGVELLAVLGELDLVATVAVDPHAHDADALVDRAARAGARGLKLHPYLHRIDAVDHAAACTLARRAHERGLWVMVCCSHGTRHVFTRSGPRLVADMVVAGLDGPIVALHAGGAAVLELLGVALDAPNVLFEYSFSVPFFDGSSVEADLAFAMRRLGPQRCMYGSDHPYVDLADAPAHLDAFLSRHGFDEDARTEVLAGTAQRLLDDHGGPT